MSIDRRKRKSQKAIMNAFTQLLSKKGLQEITMNEIAEQADVSRGTIYSNYIDKYDLLDKCIEINIENLFSYCLKDEKEQFLSKEVLLRSFQYLQSNASIYKVLFVEDGVTQFQKQLVEHSVDTLKKEGALNNLNFDSNVVTLQFYSSAVIGVIVWWIQNDQPCSAEMVTESLWNLLSGLNNK